MRSYFLLHVAVVGAYSLTCSNASVFGCANDQDCLNAPSQNGYRCLESKEPGAGECHLPGPSGKNGTCACIDLTPSALCGAGPKPIPDPSSSLQYLMIGDSISIGMEPIVFKALESTPIRSRGNSTTSSQHVSGNAASANKGVHCVPDIYLNGSDAQRWDVVSVQYGLHGLAHDVEWIDASTYDAELRSILRDVVRLTAPSTPIVFVTTTPVPNAPVNPPRYNSDVVARNLLALAAARDIIPADRLTVVDLYDWVVRRCGEGYSKCSIQLPNNVHYTAEGWEYLAGNMTAAVVQALGESAAP